MTIAIKIYEINVNLALLLIIFEINMKLERKIIFFANKKNLIDAFLNFSFVYMSNILIVAEIHINFVWSNFPL